MNLMFKKGDKIIRNGRGWYDCKPNTVYTIRRIMNYTVELEELPKKYYLIKNFKLVETFSEDLFEI